jgi:hypothetical protein
MSYRDHCLSLGIKLNDYDIALIKWRLNLLPPVMHKGLLEKYVEIWLDVLESQPNNAAKHCNGRAKANWFVKTYR